MPSSGYKNTKRRLKGDKFITVEKNTGLLGDLYPPDVVSRELDQQRSEVETVHQLYCASCRKGTVWSTVSNIPPRVTELRSWLMVGL